MPNHQPYQNQQEGQAKPQASRPEGGATSLGIGQQPHQGAETMAQRATKAVDQVKTSAIERVGDVRSRAESGIADQRGRLVERVQRVGDVLRGASEQVRPEDEFVSHYLERASQSVGRVAEYVSSSDMSRVADDARSFARTHPAWFIGGAFVAGLALGRFLKSASPAPTMGYAGGMPDTGLPRSGMPQTNWEAEERW